MPQFKRYFLILIAAASLASCSKFELEVETGNDNECPPVTSSSFIKPIPDQYIVVFKPEFSQGFRAASAIKMDEVMATASEDVLTENAIDKKAIKASFGAAMQGFTAKLSPAEKIKLVKDKRVAYIAQDYVVSLGNSDNPCDKTDVTSPQPDPSPTPNPPAPAPTGPSTQKIPWGVARAGYANATGKVAWILDSGIDFDHPDLNVDRVKSKSFVTTGDAPQSARDYHGHGTHVAGTIAAINNNFGVVGVAAGATVVSVRVLDDTGSSSVTNVIKGINYVAMHGKAGDVANLSLGGDVYQPLDDAIQAAAAKGIYFVLAAGNEGKDAINYTPARTNGNNIYTVSAMNNNDVFASFSNFGSPIDYCAPGVSIQSTYLNGGYGTFSGTSMAAPHVAGLLLITGGRINMSGYVSNDPDGNADPIAHK